MTVPSLPMNLSKVSQQGIIEFHKQCYQMLNSTWNIRNAMRDIDLAYIRENNLTEKNQRAKFANKYGDADRLQDVTVPVVLPAVESAVTYQTSVFLTGVPVFGVSSDPAFEDEALQLESIIDEHATRGMWTREFQLFFRDGFKYNLSALEVTWDRKVTADLTTDMSFSSSRAKPKETVWEGNCIKRLDMYNTFFDCRVYPTKIPEHGEFAGYTELMSRVRLKQFISELPDKLLPNLKSAFESGLGAVVPGGIESFYIPQINNSAFIKQDLKSTTNWLAWAGLAGNTDKIRYQNMYEVTTLYGRIIPSDFNLKVPAENTPQIWKFIIVNHNILIYAERQTNAHNLIPILFSQPLEDGLGYQTKSLATNVKPIQEVTTALLNSVIAARRRAISDRTLYDPSRISSDHINSPNPSAKIPVRPAAYGKNIAEAVYAFPYRDDQSPEILQQIQLFSRYSDTITGQNPVKQGQFVKGNKTQREFDTVMGNANGRDQSTSILLESQVFTPLKEILKINILQYQGTGSVFSREKQKIVDVDPVALRKAVLAFKVSDGLTPTDKLINSDAFAVALQQIGTSPQISGGYNIGPLFSYLMKTQGADLKPFEKSSQQMSYEQALQSWQAAAQNVAEIMKAISMKIENITLADIQGLVQKMLPPQPMPQQFGYDPSQQGQQQGQQQPNNTNQGGTQ